MFTVEYPCTIDEHHIGYTWNAYLTIRLTDGSQTTTLIKSGYALTYNSALKRIDKAIAKRKRYHAHEVWDVLDDHAITINPGDGK